MKRIFFGLVCIVGLGSAGQRAADHRKEGRVPDSVRRVIDSSIVLLRTHALHRDRPDWDYVRMRAYELAGQTDRWEDLGPAISWLFEAVDDRQGYMSVNGVRLQWGKAGVPDQARPERLVKKLLPGGIGYLRIPNMVMDSSSTLKVEGARKFIIDLRLNAGGPIPPMLESLSQLSKNTIPVVILTGHGTSGAAEWVAVAFKGRKHTRFIGEPTAGNAVTTVRHPIVPGQVEIFIGETVPVDRNHHSYPGHLIPDQWVPGGDDFIKEEEDRKIQAAVKWLEKN
jgi:hypothetical protein